MLLPDGPPRVAIVALGPSSHDYIVATESAGGRSKLFDAVWAVNTYGDVIAHDLLWHMDDVRVQEARAAGNPKIAAMLAWMKRHPGPIMTSRPHPDYPGTVAYPLQAVVNRAGSDYFNNTVAYAIAYAIACGVKQLSLFGVDFNWAGASEVEPGRACCEYWLGRAQLLGVEVKVAPSSTLMDCAGKPGPRYYGYDTLDVRAEMVDGAARFTMTPTDQAIDGAEIERRYDHRPRRETPAHPTEG